MIPVVAASLSKTGLELRSGQPLQHLHLSSGQRIPGNGKVRVLCWMNSNQLVQNAVRETKEGAATLRPEHRSIAEQTETRRRRH